MTRPTFLNDHIPSLTMPHPADPKGIAYTFEFPNGYGASVVKTSFSYGNEDGLWELAVLDKEGDICYDTPITEDVLGWLTDQQVSDTLYAIHDL